MEQHCSIYKAGGRCLCTWAHIYLSSTRCGSTPHSSAHAQTPINTLQPLPYAAADALLQSISRACNSTLQDPRTLPSLSTLTPHSSAHAQPPINMLQPSPHAAATALLQSISRVAACNSTQDPSTLPAHLLALHRRIQPCSHGWLQQASCAVRLQHARHLARQPEGRHLSNGQRLHTAVVTAAGSSVGLAAS